jgi:tRNA (guanine37-N1)-methyltransferase
MYAVKIFTLYPETFPGPLAGGIYGKAMRNGLWSLKTVNIRDYADDKHKTVDDTVFGGGSGMLMKPDIVANSLDKNISKGEKIFYLSPKGKKFNQGFANSLSKQNGINLICGHFEGVDDRLLSTRNIEEISIGDYVLSGGETAAFVILDAVLRLIPGVLGNKESIKDETFENSLLEYPQFTRPKVWEDANNFKHEVPEILTSGHHEKIKKWRHEKSIEKTNLFRPDLLKKDKI